MVVVVVLVEYFFLIPGIVVAKRLWDISIEIPHNFKRPFTFGEHKEKRGKIIILQNKKTGYSKGIRDYDCQVVQRLLIIWGEEVQVISSGSKKVVSSKYIRKEVFYFLFYSLPLPFHHPRHTHTHYRAIVEINNALFLVRDDTLSQSRLAGAACRSLARNNSPLSKMGLPLLSDRRTSN